jgi:hypothetical protein
MKSRCESKNENRSRAFSFPSALSAPLRALLYFYSLCASASLRALLLSPLRKQRLCARPVRSSIFVLSVLLVLPSPAPGQDNAKKDDPGYHIDKPGTITFTVGVKIKGKVEKPQVVIFLPKEKPYYRETEITHSFLNDIMEPLPLKPEEK